MVSEACLSGNRTGCGEWCQKHVCLVTGLAVGNGVRNMFGWVGLCMELYVLICVCTSTLVCVQEAQRMEFEANREQLLHNHLLEKEEMTSHTDNQIEELQEELAKLQRDRDEALLLAENDRQQVCLVVIV